VSEISLSREEGVGQRLSTFLMQRDLPQNFALLVEPCVTVKTVILLQPHRTVVANFIPGNFGLFRRNPWQPLAEPRFKNTGLGTGAQLPPKKCIKKALISRQTLRLFSALDLTQTFE